MKKIKKIAKVNFIRIILIYKKLECPIIVKAGLINKTYFHYIELAAL